MYFVHVIFIIFKLFLRLEQRIENITVTLDKMYAKIGEIVTFTLSADSGSNVTYILDHGDSNTQVETII